jgi:hypothetical protein
MYSGREMQLHAGRRTLSVDRVHVDAAAAAFSVHWIIFDVDGRHGSPLVANPGIVGSLTNQYLARLDARDAAGQKDRILHRLRLGHVRCPL